MGVAESIIVLFNIALPIILVLVAVAWAVRLYHRVEGIERTLRRIEKLLQVQYEQQSPRERDK